MKMQQIMAAEFCIVLSITTRRNAGVCLCVYMQL